MNLTELSCPSCGAPLRMKRERSLTVCPFCDTQIAAQWAAENRRSVSLSADLEHRVVPFTVARATFEAVLLEWLAAGDYTPDDVLSRALVQEHLGLLVPLYRAQGTWRGSFTASAGFDRTESYVDHETRFEDGEHKQVPVTKTRTVTDWRPMSGEASGSYDLILIASQRVPEGLRDFCQQRARAHEEGEPLSADHLDDCVAESFEQPFAAVWEARGAAELDQLIDAEVRTRIPGDRARHIRPDIQREERSITGRYQPFWVATYAYGGETYTFALDGTDPAHADGRRPEDAERRQRIQALFKPLRTWGIIWAVCLFVGFLIIVPAIIAVVVGIPHLIYLYTQASREKTAILDASRAVRQQLLAEVKQRRGLPTPDSSS